MKMLRLNYVKNHLQSLNKPAMKFMDSLNFTKDPFAGPDQVV